MRKYRGGVKHVTEPDFDGIMRGLDGREGVGNVSDTARMSPLVVDEG